MEPTEEPIVQGSGEPVVHVYRTKEDIVRLSDVLEALEISGEIVSVTGAEEGIAPVPGRVELLFADGEQAIITLGRESVYESIWKEETALLTDVLSALGITGEIAAVAGAEETENGWAVSVPGTVSVIFSDENAAVITLRRLVELTESDVNVEQSSITVEDLISGGAITEEQAIALGLVVRTKAPVETKATRQIMNTKGLLNAVENPVSTKTEAVVLDIRLTNDAVKTENGQYQVPVRLSAPIELVEEGYAVQTYSVQAFHIADGKAAAVPVRDVVIKDGKLVGFTIVTDGFSPYVVKYTVDFVYQTAKAELSLDFSEFTINGGQDGIVAYDNASNATAVDVAGLIDRAIGQEESALSLGVRCTALLQNQAKKESFDDAFLDEAAVSVDGDGVEYVSGQIVLTDDVKEANVTFTTEKAKLTVAITSYAKPEKPAVPETADGFAYRFHQIGETATAEEILSANEIISSYYNILSVSDPALVSADAENGELTALDHFDEVTLILSLSDGTEVSVRLSNPAPVKAGETVITEGVGSFAAAEEVPTGTRLSVNADPQVPEGIMIGGAKKRGGPVESEPVFFDISLIGPDGEKVETGANVTIATDIALPEAPEGYVAKVTGVKVYHIGEKGDVEELSGVSYALAESRISAVSFETPGFSLFAVTYTVDFVLDGVQFSMPGGGALLLSELFEALRIEADATQIASVEFTDPTLLTVEPYGDEWRIYSHCAFTTAETLTITMLDGTVYVIDVTDDVSNSMNDAVAVVTINGSSTPPATVRSDEEYTIHLEFREVPGSVQFPTTGNQITYQIPEGFRPHTNLDNVPILLTYTEDNISHTLDGCYYSVDTNGLLTLHLTEIAKQKLDISGDGIFKVDITGFFSNPTGPIDWGGGHIWDITVDDTPHLDSSKSGGYDSTTNKVKYYVNVASTGNNNGVTVTDTISGTALSLDQGSVVVKDKNWNTVDGITVNYSGNTFSLTLPDMANGDRYTVEYTASVDLDGITNGGTIEETENSVSINGDPITHNLEHSISYNPFAKSAGTPIDTDDPDIKYIPWTVTVNQACTKDMHNVTFTDTIASGSAGIMQYANKPGEPEGIVVRWYDGNDEQQGSQIIPWQDAHADPLDTATSWYTTIPIHGHYKYVYTYYTKVNVAAANGNTIVSNSVGDDEYHSASSQTTVPPGSGAIDVVKEAVGTPTQEKMSWSVTMTVPASGLSKAVLTDYLPKKDYSGTKLQDTLLQDTLRVTGLDEENEDYTLRVSKDRFVITFFKNKAKTEPGLNASSAQRTITVTFDTANDENWASLLRNDWHLNSVLFEGGNGSVTDTAQQQVPPSGFEKQAHSMGLVTNTYENNDEVLLIEYKLDLYGVEETDFTNGVLTITDNYNSTYLELYDLVADAYGNSENGLSGMDEYWGQVIQNGYRGGAHRSTKVRIDDDHSGTLTFVLNRSDFPGPQVYDSANNTWTEGDTLLSHYQIIYYMVVKDGTTQAQLDADSIANPNRKITLVNTAHWKGMHSTASVDYGIDVLDKSHINPIDANGAEVAADDTHYDSSTGMTGFQIVVNPTRLRLNDGSPLTLKDEFSDTLSVDYSSIKVYVYDASDNATLDNGSVVTYDYKGNVGTFHIPDETKVVIKYNAKVIGAPGSWVRYGNKVEMNGYKDGVNGQSRIGGTGEAGFNINSIRVYKYRAGDMTQPIEGVTFTLVDENGEPVVYTNTSTKAGHVHNAGDPVTYTTGANGYAEIKPSEEDDGFSLQKGITYYLKETGTPSTYAFNNTIYRFTISDNPNYSNYEYHSGDIMKIYNWPTTGRLEIRKSIVGGLENMTDEDKRQIKFTIEGWYDSAKTSPVKVDAWGYTVKQADATDGMAEFSRDITYADFVKRTENGTNYYSYLMEDLVDGYYEVIETRADLNGYQTVTTTTAVYSIAKGTTTKTAQSSEVVGTNGAFMHVTDQVWREVDITNTYDNPTGTELTIKKVNGDLPLSGAKFKLEKWDAVNSAWTVYNGSSTDENGVFTITYDNRVSGVRLTGLVDGTYRVTEIKAPNNYEITGDGVFGFVVSDSTVTWEHSTGTASVAYDSTNKLFTVNNEVKHNYLLTKVDGANVSLKLQGAKFGVYEHIPGNSDAQDRAHAKTWGVEPLLVYTSDANGQFEVLANDKNGGAAVYDDKTYTYNAHTGEWTLDENGNTGRTYFIMEIEAPLGYSLPSDPPLYYYYFGHMPLDVATTQAANLATSRRSATITNDLIELTVQKLWRDLDGNTLYQNDVDVIEFALFQTAKTVNVETGAVVREVVAQYPDDQTFYTIERDSSNNWPALTIDSLPQVGPRVGDEKVYYTYEVEETVPDGYQVTYTASADGRTLSIINRPESTELEVTKVWSDNTPEKVRVDSNIKFQLQRKLKQGADTWKNYRGEVYLCHWDGAKYVLDYPDWTVRWEELPKEYMYRVVETIQNSAYVNRFIAAYSDGQNGVADGTITVTNEYQATSISAEKIWVNTSEAQKYYCDISFSLEYWNAADSRWYAVASTAEHTNPVYAVHTVNSNHVLNTDAVTVNESGHWVVSWNDLSKEFIYRVVETFSDTNTQARYVVKYSDNQQGVTGGTIKITNIRQDDLPSEDKVYVKKVWVDANGNDLPASDIPNVTITGNLTRSVMVPDTSSGPVYTVTLKRYESQGTGGTYALLETDYRYVKEGGIVTLGDYYLNGPLLIFKDGSQVASVPQANGQSHDWYSWTVNSDCTIELKYDDTITWQQTPFGTITIQTGYEAEFTVPGRTEDHPFTLNAANNWYAFENFSDAVGEQSVWTVTGVDESALDGYTLSFINGEGIHYGTIYMKNTENTSKKVSVDKKWFGMEGEITTWPTGVVLNVQLMKRAANGTVAEVTEPSFYTSPENTANLTWSNPLQLSASTPRATWKYLDDLQTGESYEVHEVSVEYGGSTYSVTDGKVTVNGVTYQVFNGTVVNKKATVTNAALTDVNVTKTWDLPAGENVSFEKPDNAVVASGYLSGDTVTVPKTALVIGVQLHRQGHDGNGDPVANSDFDLSNPAEAKYGEVKQLFSAATPTAGGRYTGIFADAANWGGAWQNLPTASVAADGAVTTYTYSVEEVLVTVPANIMHNGSNGQVNILNQFMVTPDAVATPGTTAITNKLIPAYHLDVSKVWKDSNGNPITGEEIEFQLLRQSASSSGSYSGNDVTVHITTGSNAGDGEYTHFTVPSGTRIVLDVSTYEVHPDEYNTVHYVLETYEWIYKYYYWHWDDVTQYGTPSHIELVVPDADFCIHFKGNNNIESATLAGMFSYTIQSTASTSEVITFDPSGMGYIVDDTATFTLNAANNWTMRFMNLPLSGVENGSTVNYTYTVQEVSPNVVGLSGTDSNGNAFTVSYSGGPYDPAPASAGGYPQNGAITITNQYEQVRVNPVDLNILKLKAGASGNEPASDIQFTLKDAYGNTVATGSTDVDGKLTLTIPATALDAAAGSKTFTLYEDDTPTNCMSDSPWTVTVTGTSASSGGVTNYSWAVTGVTGHSGTPLTPASLYYTILNPSNKADLKIVKIDETTRGQVTETKLTGVEFTLYKWNGINYAAAGGTIATNTNGEAEFEVGFGEYMLVETKAPSGYNMMMGAVYFNVEYNWTNNQSVLTRYAQPCDFSGVRTVIAGDTETINVTYTQAASGNPATFTIGNTPGVELPATGGPGTAAYTVSGLVLILGALWMLLRRKRETN